MWLLLCNYLEPYMQTERDRTPLRQKKDGRPAIYIYLLLLFMMLGGLFPVATSIAALEPLPGQVNIPPACEGPTFISGTSPEVVTFLQAVRFTHPAATIRIGLPLNDISIADQVWIRIGQRNGYSHEIIPETLSAEWPLQFDPASGFGFTPYFSYTVTLSHSYLIQVRTLRADGVSRCEVLRDGYYEIVDSSYVDRTHEFALPLVVEADPPPVNYSIGYADPFNIKAFPEYSVSSTDWGILNFSTIAEFQVDEPDHAIALADMDGDLEPEIIRTVWDTIEVRRMNGQLLWSYALPSVADQVIIDDIDSDGKPNILVSTWMVGESDYGRVVVIDESGNLKWQREVLSNAHGIAVWHPTDGSPHILVGTCAGLIYSFSHEGVMVDFAWVVTDEWASVDTVAVGDVDGDGQDEFVLGLWLSDRADVMVLTPALEIKWQITVVNLRRSLGTSSIFDGIALTQAPDGGKFIWVATSPLWYSTTIDPVLVKIDGRSAQVLVEHHLNDYEPFRGVGITSDFVTVRAIELNDDPSAAEVLIDYQGELWIFNPEGLRGVYKPLEGQVVSSSKIFRQDNGNILIAISYEEDLTGSHGVKVLGTLESVTQTNPIFSYDISTMQGSLVANITDSLGLMHTKIVNLEGLDHFDFELISSQEVGVPFQITIIAKDGQGNTLPFFGSVRLSDSTGTINPSVTDDFSNGVWAGKVRIEHPESNVVITASAEEIRGNSNTFEVFYYRDTIGVFRNGGQRFFLKNENSSGVADLEISYGVPGDIPIAGDWDGNRITTIGVYRPDNSTFYLRNSNTTGFADLEVNYGIPGDIPIPGDWDGDGTTTIGVYRPSNSTFYLRNSNTTGFADLEVNYGISGDIPLAGNWDGLP